MAGSCLEYEWISFSRAYELQVRLPPLMRRCISRRRDVCVLVHKFVACQRTLCTPCVSLRVEMHSTPSGTQHTPTCGGSWVQNGTLMLVYAASQKCKCDDAASFLPTGDDVGVRHRTRRPARARAPTATTLTHGLNEHPNSSLGRKPRGRRPFRAR